MKFLRQPLLAQGAIAAGLVIALIGAAQAQTISTANSTAASQLQVNGVAPSGCVISLPQSGAVTNASLNAGATSATVTFPQFVDGNAVPLGANISLQLPVVCNTANVLTVSTLNSGLTLPAGSPAPGPGFRNRLDYQVDANWAGQSTTISTAAASSIQIASADAQTGAVGLTIRVPSGGDPLVAGTYSDRLIVDLHPAN